MSAAPNPGPGSARRAPTLRQVAERAGVSPATVSRVLTGKRPVTEEIRTRVQQAIKELDYVVNEQARSLSGATTKTVAILLDHLTSPFHNRVASGIEQEAAEQGRMCLVSTTGGDPARELSLVNMLRARNTEAVVLIGGAVDTPEYRSRIAVVARLLDAAGSRLVLVGRPAPAAGVPVSVVEYDNEGGAYAAVSYLLSMGHRRIAWLGSDPAFTTAAARIAGYRRALEAHGVPVDPALIYTMASGMESRASGYDAMLKVFRELGGADGPEESGGPEGAASPEGSGGLGGPALAARLPFTAVFCYDDLVASGVLAAFRANGIEVPGDVSVVGYNDEPTALDVVPNLTTVHIPHADLGRAAIRLALDRGRSQTVALGDRLAIATYLVIRDSVRRVDAPGTGRRSAG